MLSQQKGHDGRRMDGRMDSSVLLPPITPQSIISTADWSSLAELSTASVCPACCLSLYTPKGGGLWHTHNTPTRTQTRTDTHTHTHTFPHLPRCPHTPRHALRSCLHHPCSRNRSDTRAYMLDCAPLALRYTVCVLHDTRAVTSCTAEAYRADTLSYTYTHTHSLKTEFTGEGKNRSLKEWIILKRLLPEEERNTWKEHVHFMLWIRERKGSETLQPSGVVFFIFYLTLCHSVDRKKEFVWVNKQTQKKKKKTLFRCFLASMCQSECAFRRTDRSVCFRWFEP